MVLEVVTDLRCDGPACQATIGGIRSAKSNGVYARQRAAKFGWIFRFERDYCPNCATTVQNVKRRRDMQGLVP